MPEQANIALFCCKTCGQEKPAEAFYASRTCRYGLALGACRECRKVMAVAERRKKHDVPSKMYDGRERRCFGCNEPIPLLRDSEEHGGRCFCLKCVGAGVHLSGVLKSQIESKRCTTCGQEKTLTEFFKQKHGAGDVSSTCKSCSKVNTYEWRKCNRARRNAHAKKYRETHRTQVRLSLKSWHAKHPDYVARRAKHRFATDPKYREMIRNGKSRYRARLAATLCTLTTEQWEAILALYDRKCAYCGQIPKVMSMDHVMPISRGGTHTADNVVPACLPCNLRKNRRTPGEWETAKQELAGILQSQEGDC